MRMRILMHLGLSRFVLMVVWGLEHAILTRLLLGLKVVGWGVGGEGGGAGRVRLASDDGADMAAAVGAIGGRRQPDRRCLGGSTMCGSARVEAGSSGTSSSKSCQR